jgi:hypothetical protein
MNPENCDKPPRKQDLKIKTTNAARCIEVEVNQMYIATTSEKQEAEARIES